MTTKKAKEDSDITVWIKADGKTQIELNNRPATIKHAESLGWKRKK